MLKLHNGVVFFALWSYVVLKEFHLATSVISSMFFAVTIHSINFYSWLSNITGSTFMNIFWWLAFSLD